MTVGGGAGVVAATPRGGEAGECTTATLQCGGGGAARVGHDHACAARKSEPERECQPDPQHPYRPPPPQDDGVGRTPSLPASTGRPAASAPPRHQAPLGELARVTHPGASTKFWRLERWGTPHADDARRRATTAERGTDAAPLPHSRLRGGVLAGAEDTLPPAGPTRVVSAGHAAARLARALSRPSSLPGGTLEYCISNLKHS